MAIYHLSAKIISRSSGRSAVAAAAYRSAELMHDHRQGLDHDYSNRGGVLSTEILLPENAPGWMSDRSQLWNAVEKIERRKDAQLSREIVVALPHELNDDARHDLVRSFVQEQFVSRGMVADVAVHSPGSEGDERNHHAHIMLTTRGIEGDGFGKKAREWNATATLEDWRESWADAVNERLERSGHDQKIDHRSLSDQREEAQALQADALERGDLNAARHHELEAMALNRDPLPDIGWKAWSMERRGERTEVGDAWRATRARMDAVRELVTGLRERLADVAQRVSERVQSTRLSNALSQLRASKAPQSEAETEGGKSGLSDAMDRLRQSRGATADEKAQSAAHERVARAKDKRGRSTEQEPEAPENERPSPSRSDSDGLDR